MTKYHKGTSKGKNVKLLFRLKSFNDVLEVKDYFKSELLKRDNNYFFNVNRLQQIKCNETIYFSFDGYLVATGIFMGKIVEDREKDDKFIFGHQLANIKIIDSDIKLNTTIFGTNTTYLDTDEKIEEIEKIVDK